MTGFGRSEMSADNKKITIEMKSVNHRYLDVNIKTPKKLSFYDTFLRGLLKKYIERGKIDIFVTFEDESDNGKVLTYDSALAMEYAKYIEQMGKDLKIENDITTSSLIKCQDIFVMKDSNLDEEKMEQLLLRVIMEMRVVI